MLIISNLIAIQLLENDGNAPSGYGSMAMLKVGSGNHSVIKLPEIRAMYP
jgi:hypothetical protein